MFSYIVFIIEDLWRHVPLCHLVAVVFYLNIKFGFCNTFKWRSTVT